MVHISHIRFQRGSGSPEDVLEIYCSNVSYYSQGDFPTPTVKLDAGAPEEFDLLCTFEHYFVRWKTSCQQIWSGKIQLSRELLEAIARHLQSMCDVVDRLEYHFYIDTIPPRGRHRRLLESCGIDAFLLQILMSCSTVSTHGLEVIERSCTTQMRVCQRPLGLWTCRREHVDTPPCRWQQHTHESAWHYQRRPRQG